MREILKVLIIDDTDSDRLSVRRSLRHAGFDVDITEVSDGRTAIETLRQAPFDVAFLDFKLPDGDGLDVLKEARQAGVKTPIIAFTAFGNEDVAVELMKAGATDYLSKNRTSADTVKQCVRRAMALRQLQREKEQALRALVSSEKLTRSVINSLPQFVIVVDRMGNVINVNESCDATFTSKFGATDSIQGKNVEDVAKQAPQPYRKELVAAFRSAKSVLKGTRKLVEKEISCPPDFVMMMRVTPLVREAGGAVILMVDVAESSRRAAEFDRNRQMLSGLLDALPTPQCTVSPDAVITRANGAFANLVGSTSAGLVGRELSDFLDGDAKKFAAAIDKIDANGLVQLALQVAGTATKTTLAAAREDGAVVAIDVLFQPA